MITCLEECNLTISELDLYASIRSAGTVLYYTTLLKCRIERGFVLKHYDYVLFQLEPELPKLCPHFAQASEIV